MYISGFMLPNDKDIAMKFTLPSEASTAYDEYKMYCYLDAINSTQSEKYGIPSVYYYGKCQQTGLILMGFSVLEKNIEDLAKSGQLLQHDVNVLIILRDFVSWTRRGIVDKFEMRSSQHYWNRFLFYFFFCNFIKDLIIEIHA